MTLPALAIDPATDVSTDALAPATDRLPTDAVAPATDRCDGALPAIAGGALSTARRRRLGQAVVLALAAAAAPGLVLAHHGYAGVHDFSRPIYLAGVIETIWIGQPHVRLRLRLDPELTLPRDREAYRALEDAEARQMLGRLRLPDRRGPVDVVLNARMNRSLISDPDMLPAGLRTEIIAYRRVTQDEYRGEILGVLVRLQDGRMLVGSTSMRARGSRGAAPDD